MYRYECSTWVGVSDELVYKREQVRVIEIISNLAKDNQIELSIRYVFRYRASPDMDVSEIATALLSPIDRDARDVHRLHLVAERGELLNQYSDGAS